jgi:hypothetical protein
MTPQAGQRLKIVLRTGTVVDGILEEWAANQVQLRSLDGDSILIIRHPDEDIVLIKIMLDNSEKKKTEPEENKTELEKKFDEVHQKSDPFSDLSNKSLADLKVEIAKQDREIIARKLREHRPTVGQGLNQYVYPGTSIKSEGAKHGHTRPSKK